MNESEKEKSAGSGKGKNDQAEKKISYGSEMKNGSGIKKSMLIKLGAAVIVLIAALAYGVPAYIRMTTHESTDDAFIDGTITPINPRVSGHVRKIYVGDNQKVKAGDLIMEIDPADFQTKLDEAGAALQAARASQVSSELDVELVSISVSAGLEEAKAGEEAAQSAVKAAKAQVDSYAAKCDQIRAQLDNAEASLKKAEADAVVMAAQHQRDAADLKRYQAMFRQHTIPEQQLEYVTAAEQMSRARLDGAKKDVELHQSMIREAQASLKAAQNDLDRGSAEVSVRVSQLDQAVARLRAAGSAPKQEEQQRKLADRAKAEVEKAQAQARQAELNLSYTRIYAPADGFVTRKSVEEGMFVQTGQPVMSIVSSDFWITANFKETQLTRMRPGQSVEIRVDSYPDRIFKGHVESIQRGTGSIFSLLPPQNATGNFVKVVQRIPVKILFDNESEIGKYLFVPGLSAIPEVNVSEDVKVADASSLQSGDNRMAHQEKKKM